MVYVDGMQGIIKHPRTLQWLYVLVKKYGNKVCNTRFLKHIACGAAAHGFAVSYHYNSFTLFDFSCVDFNVHGVYTVKIKKCEDISDG